MKIQNFKKIKPDVYEMILENGKKHELYAEIILKYELLLYKEISQEKLDTILSENQIFEAYFFALKKISQRLKSKLEIKKLLLERNFSSASIDYTLDRLEKEGYLNEKVYASAYINDAINLTLYGPLKIENNLKERGINHNIIMEEVNKIDIDTWKERVHKIISKKEKANRYGASVFKNKLFLYLTNMGYPSSIVKDCLSNYELSCNDTFSKEANKTWITLSRKYIDKELENKFKQKMYQKGFNMSEINDYLASQKFD